ncbi:MAG: Oar protein [Bryobacterales bacterium]|nr:Oar protein [Bryobacterales bacterium]
MVACLDMRHTDSFSPVAPTLRCYLTVTFWLFGYLSIPAASAQSVPNTTLSGTISDSSGAPVPNAGLELVNAANNFSKRATSDQQGRFLFSLIPPGSYQFSVIAAGFAPFTQQGITLDVDVPATLRVKLALAGASQQVTVTADTPKVDSESGTLRQVVSEKYIQELPLNGRNAAALVFMAPGTVVGKGTDTATYATTSDTQAVSVNGTFGNQVSYKLDGASHQDNITNLNAAFPNPDALAEFSVQTNNFDAQYGGSGGAIVNIVTRSGTNAVHGTVFEYLRNGALNARNFFAPQVDALKRNQFGASAGGPIKRDTLFFFGSYQGTLLSNITYGNTAFVPTVAQRTGDFSGSKTMIDPATGKGFANNVIPAAQISPIAAAILQKVPVSNDPTGKLLYAVPSTSQNHQELAKADYYANRHQFTASYFHVHYTDPGWNGNGTLLNYKIGQDQNTHSFKGGDTWTITPSLVNSLTLSGLILDSTQIRTAPFSIFDFGAINATKPERLFQETGISVTSYSGWGSGGTQPPGNWRRDNYDISDVVSWNRGSHAMHLGAQYTPYTRFDSKTGYQEEPLLTFTGTATGNGLADLLLGKVNTFTQTAGKVKFTRGQQLNAFFQDNWRLHPRFTLNLGLRWEPFLPYGDPVAEQVGGYIPGYHSQRFPNAPAGLVFAGDPGFPSNGLKTGLGNFAPRLGFAWTAVAGKHTTTVRGGWGRFYILPFARLYNNFVQNAPFSPSVSLFGVSLADPFGSAGVANPFPPFAPVNPSANAQFILPVTYQFFDPNWHIGHTNSWNFTIEHQLTASLVARFAYVGTAGRDLQYFRELDPAVYSPGATTANTNARRTLSPNFASMIKMTNDGYSNYNALQVTLEKRFTRQLMFVTHYTFSKSLDNESVEAQFTVSSPNPYSTTSNYGLSDFNTPHNFSFWSVWQAPALAGSPAWLRLPLGGWQSSGIWSWRSGTPFNVTSGQDRSYSGVGLDRADLTGDPNLPGNRTRGQIVSQYFNTAAFALNAPGTFGNVPRNYLAGPSYFNVDFSMQKSFQPLERLRVTLRGDFFNIFNNVHFNAPGASVSSTSTFGKITSAGDPRILQIALRLHF